MHQSPSSPTDSSVDHGSEEKFSSERFAEAVGCMERLAQTGVHLGVAGIDQLGYSERLDVDGSCLKTL